MTHIKSPQQFRAFIVSELKRRKETVYRLSRNSDVSPPTIHKIIYGDNRNPSLETFLSLVHALGFKVKLEQHEESES